jgi:hypothetical protein
LKIPDVRIPDSRHFRGLGIYKENTYVGGVGQKVKPLLDADKLTGNRNGLGGQYSSRIASGRSFGRFLLLGASSVHVVSVIPLHAVFLERSKALSLLVSSETRPSSSGVWKKLGRAAALPKWSAMAELEGTGLVGASAVAADCVPVLMICFILRVPDLAETAFFSAVGVLGAGCSGAADAACPAEAGAGSV